MEINPLQLDFGEGQTRAAAIRCGSGPGWLFLSQERASGQTQRAKKNVEAPALEAVPGAVQKTGPRRKGRLFIRNTAPLAPEGAPLYTTESWPGPPQVLESEVIDANPPRIAQERTLISEMEGYQENWERIVVEVDEKDNFLLCIADNT